MPIMLEIPSDAKTGTPRVKNRTSAAIISKTML